MGGARKCQQTTTEALTKVCSEAISRVHKFEGEMLGVRSPGCPGVLSMDRDINVGTSAMAKLLCMNQMLHRDNEVRNLHDCPDVCSGTNFRLGYKGNSQYFLQSISYS